MIDNNGIAILLILVFMAVFIGITLLLNDTDNIKVRLRKLEENANRKD